MSISRSPRKRAPTSPRRSTHKARANPQPQQQRIEYLEKKIQTKDEVLAELMAEHIALKKELGEL